MLLQFSEESLLCGLTEDIIPIVRKSQFVRIPFQPTFSGIILIDGTVTYNISPTTPPPHRQVTASVLVDTGSLYSIANLALLHRLGLNLSELPISPVVCAGIDGKPMPLRELCIRSLAFGSFHIASPEKELKIFAADIPGLDSLGLHGRPFLILGMDLLASRDIGFDLRAQMVLLGPGNMT